MTRAPAAPGARRPPPLAVRLAIVPAVAALLLAGLWLVAGRIAASYDASIALGAVWFLLAAAVLGKLTKHRPALRRWVRTGTIGTSAVVLAWFYWTSIRETTVQERVATAAPMGAPDAGGSPAPAAAADDDEARPAPRRNRTVAAGRVESLAHDGSGRAQVIALAEGGRVLTLTDFDIDPGPQVVVRLVAGDDPAGADHVVLGDLKGSRGDQQYRLPAGTRLERHRTVVFWCIPFSQARARARLDLG